jgi:CYTH domain-containing protein
LLNAVPSDATDSVDIVDRYITGTRLRLRRVIDGDTVTYKLGQKVRVADDDPERVQLTNIYLSAHEYDVFAALPARELRKRRRRFRHEGRLVVVDEFLDRDLVLAETELGPDEARLPLPAFAIRDVTEDDAYSGGALAR